MRVTSTTPARKTDTWNNIGHVAWHTSPTEYVVWRATANHFELARVDGTWRITARTSRMLNGDPSAHALLSAGLAGEPVGSP
jgi:hypothetical protein